MTTPKHSRADALSPSDPVFLSAYCKAQQAISDAVIEFERTTGRTVDGLSLQWVNCTRLSDPEPSYVLSPGLAWLPRADEVRR